MEAKADPIVHDESINHVQRIKAWYRALPDKKRYIELVTAVLTVPVMVTVLYTNIRNIQGAPSANPTPLPSPQVTLVQTPVNSPVTQHTNTSVTPAPTGATSTPTPKPECRKTVGPMKIDAPAEGETVMSDPVPIDISTQSTEYCAVVWSYRINTGSWSEYTDKSIFLYGLSPGNKTLEVRIKSVASGDQITLTRSFIKGGATETPTPQGTASASVQ